MSAQKTRSHPRLAPAICLSVVIHAILLTHVQIEGKPQQETAISVRLEAEPQSKLWPPLPARAHPFSHRAMPHAEKVKTVKSDKANPHATTPQLLTTPGSARSNVSIPRQIETTRRNAVAEPTASHSDQAGAVPQTAVATTAAGTMLAGNSDAMGNDSDFPVSAARYLGDRNDPPYPERSRQMGEQGLVEVKVTVGQDGQVLDVILAKSSGYVRLDAAAMDLGRQGPYMPAHRGNQAIKSVLRLRLSFRLH
jgi:protein TonB